MFNLRWPQGVTTDSTLPDVRQGAGSIDELLSSNRHVVVEPPDDFSEMEEKEPEIEFAIATEDDFEDDCPLCMELRERVRKGEEIEIVKVRWG